MTSFCRSKWAYSNRAFPCSSIIVIIALIAFGTFLGYFHTIIMNLGTFQLSYIDGIGIFFTSCDVSNLAGNVLRSITDGSSRLCRFPNTSRIFTVVNSRRIITDYIRIDRSYRIGTKSYAFTNLSISIMAKDDGIFELIIC